MMSVKGFFRGLLKFVLWSLLVLLLAHTAFNIAGSLKVRAAKQQLAAAGLPMTWEQLFPPPAKDSENAAPILKSAFDLIRPNWPSSHKYMTKEERQAANTLAGNTPVCAIPLEVPFLTNMPVSKRAEWARRMNADPYTKILRLLNEAAARPQSDFHLDMDKDKDAFVLPVRLFFDAGKLLHAHAILNAEFGSPAVACSDVITMLRLAHLIGDDPLLITQLTRISLNTKALDALQFTFQTQSNQTVNASDLRRLMAELQRNESGRTNLFPTCMDAERLYAATAMEEMLDGYLPEFKLFSNLGVKMIRKPVLIYILSPWFKLCYADYLEHLAALRMVNAPAFYQSHQRVEMLCSSNNVPHWDLLTNILLTMMPYIFSRINCDQAALQSARLGLTAELYRQQHGQYPEQLDDLAALTPIPVDPFTGKPFVFRHEGAGFKLYSLGPNQKDDGGVPEDNIKHHKDYDIVWDMTPTAIAKTRAP